MAKRASTTSTKAEPDKNMTMEQRSEIKFTISPDKEIELMAAPGVFIPTATTNILIQSIRDTISNPSNLLDLGCGNGINSSILAGWRFKPSFDVFEDLDLDGDDIYDSLLQDKSKVRIEKSGRVIDFGIDIKKSMVQRAKLVGSFKNVLQAEAAKIPVESNSIGVIYSNVIRDFDSNGLDYALKECARIIKPSGSLIFSTPTPEYQESLFYYTQFYFII